MRSCVYIPEKGKKLFKSLRNHFNYNKAWDIYLKAIHPDFLRDYKNSLTLDEDGVPTYDSIISNPYMKKFIGVTKIEEMLNSQYDSTDNSLVNYSKLLEEANLFNTQNENRNDYVAIVETTKDNELRVNIVPKTEENIRIFTEQYGTNKLNEKLLNIFKEIGINVGNLSELESKAGRIGVTDFSKAKDIANGLATMIRVANNMEGANALTEEFSHLLIGIYRDEPLVQRALNSLMQNEDSMKFILGDTYEDTVNYFENDMQLVAEETLGHILKDNLVKEVIPTPAPSLFRRLINWLIKQFKHVSPSVAMELYDTIDTANTSMSKLATDILRGTRTITEEDVKASHREVMFNALSDKIDRNIEILKKATQTEIKRSKIQKNQSEEEQIKARDLISELQQFANDKEKTVEGITYYAKNALEELRKVEEKFKNIDNCDASTKFGILRYVRMYIQSYGSFIDNLNDAFIEDENIEEDEKPAFIGDENLKEIIKELNDLSRNLTRRFSKKALPAFAEFLKPFLGEEIVIPYGKKAGSKITVDTLLREAEKDISFFDMWLDSMSNSSDLSLQLFNEVVRTTKDDTRLEVIDEINKMQLLREKAERLGIKDFSFIFERDDKGNKTGNYIGKINHGQYAKDIKEFNQYLEEKYGKNPSGEKAKEKIKERMEWLDKHTVKILGERQPNPAFYTNKTFENLSKDEKDILKEYLKIKWRLDTYYDSSRVEGMKAIQMRKPAGQRIWEGVTSPSKLYENIKEHVKESLLVQEDDDRLFGETTQKGLTDFEGNEFMTLPMLYTTRLKNPNDLNEDAIGALMNYAYSTILYKNMSKIVDPLEVGKILVTDPQIRKVNQTRGEDKVVEKLKGYGEKYNIDIIKNRTNIEQKLNDFFESQIYGKYLKEGGTFTIKDNKVSVQKVVSAALKYSSLASLGFNWLANMANVTLGIAMHNIEVAAGEFIDRKSLFNADKAYLNNIMAVVAELNSRTKTNKLDLFYQLFNIKQGFRDNLKKLQSKSLIRRIFGESLAFIGQEAGDHWLYGRVAIAMAMRKKVLLNGKEMSLWDALEVKSIEGSDTIKELNYKDITELDGKPLDIHEFGRLVNEVNQRCVGIYNEEDMNAANRVAAGRLLQQYRKWMKVMFNNRFQKSQYNLTTKSWHEGYYRTLGRVLLDWHRSGIRFNTYMHNLTNEEKANIKRCRMELIQFFAVWALVNLINWKGDDKNKRPWALKLAEYSSRRLLHEMGAITPSTIMAQELFKTVSTPFPIYTHVRDGFNLINSAIDPRDYFDEIQSGPYKGMSTLEKNFIKAPIWYFGLPQYKQISKFTGELDNQINYLVRPSF